jgi:hypothetical protein
MLGQETREMYTEHQAETAMFDENGAVALVTEAQTMSRRKGAKKQTEDSGRLVARVAFPQE